MANIKINALSEASSLTNSDFTVIDNGTVTKKYKINNLESASNKVTSISSSSTNDQYPSAKLLYDTNQATLAVAEGKTKTYVINSQSDITGTKGSDENYTNVTAIAGITVGDLNVGDIILIKATSSPDYWVSKTVGSISLDKLETIKVETIPAGGSAGQILKKNSNTNYDTAWTSIKTINNNSILGTGDITASAVSGVNDGTNWTSININGTSKDIPSVIVFNTAYDATSNKAATMADITNAITNAIGGSY